MSGQIAAIGAWILGAIFSTVNQFGRKHSNWAAMKTPPTNEGGQGTMTDCGMAVLADLLQCFPTDCCDRVLVLTAFVISDALGVAASDE